MIQVSRTIWPSWSFGDQFFDFGVARFGAHLKHGGEDLFGMLAADGDESFGIGFVRGDRFFHHDMQAGLERGDAEAGVLVMRRGNDDGIDFAGTNHFFAVGEDF